MSYEVAPGRTGGVKRFTLLANTHHLKYHLLRDELGTECPVYEVGAVKRMIWFLDAFEARIRSVAKGKEEPWIKTDRGFFAMSSSAKLLWYSIRDVAESAPKSLVEGRRLNPWLELGLSLAYEWQPQLCFRTNQHGLLDGADESARKAIAEMFRIIRAECNTKAFRDKVNGHNRSAKESYFRCARYMLSLLREHARPLILRVDLYYEGDAKDISESEAARKAEDKFMRALRENRIVPDVLRYIVKREDGLERRIHYHLLLAMDGDKHRDAYHYAEVIGKFWVNGCVGSPALASYFNVWLRRQELEYCCLGHLHHADADKLEGLRRALWYLCEPGAHVLVPEGLGRNLRRGLAAGSDRIDARGRPRKHGASMEVAERILLAPVPAGKERVVLPDLLLNSCTLGSKMLGS
jgi:hypothetical protein